jgi:hypothetical protein
MWGCTLTATLCVEGPDVVINNTRRLLIYVFVEHLTAEERYIILCIHGPVERDSDIHRSETGQKQDRCDMLWLVQLQCLDKIEYDYLVPDCISLAASLTRSSVRRFRKPNWSLSPYLNGSVQSISPGNKISNAYKPQAFKNGPFLSTGNSSKEGTEFTNMSDGL